MAEPALHTSPSKTAYGEDIRVYGEGWPGSFLTFVVNYEHRSEQYQARVVDAQWLAEFLEKEGKTSDRKLGDFDYTIMCVGEVDETAIVRVIDRLGQELATAVFEVG